MWSTFMFMSIFIYLINIDVTNGTKKESEIKTKGNILCLMPIPSPSHHIWNRALYSSLAIKGYNVTALSIEVDVNPVPNLHYIQLENVYQTLQASQNYDLLEYAAHSTYTSISQILGVFGAADNVVLSTEGFKKLLAYPDDFKFDLVLYDYTGIPGLLGFLDKFKYPPLIGMTAFTNPPNTKNLVGNPVFPSLVPYYNTELPQDMRFWQRSLNLFYYLHDCRQRKKLLQEAQARAEIAFGKKLINLEELESKASLVLVNTHPSMDVPEPLLPNVIQVGGMHIQEAKPIPEKIGNFIQSGKKGSVLFSLGSSLRSALIGQHRIDMFVNALARLPDYNFLWKYEEDGLEVPKNIMLQKWFSQNDILAHPNLKLFITHSGLLSSQEATWHGVPMLGVPFFGDQRANIKKGIDAGVAEKLDLFTMTEDEIYNKIKMMLERPSYHENMSRRSSIFRDRLSHPLQEALWWSEYILKHKGALHFKTEALTLGAPVVYMWDLLLVWLGGFIGIFALIIHLLKYVFYSNKNIRKTQTIEKAKKSRKID